MVREVKEEKEVEGDTTKERDGDWTLEETLPTDLEMACSEF